MGLREKNAKSFSLLSKIHAGSTYWFHLKVTFKEAKKKEAEPFKLHGYLCL